MITDKRTKAENNFIIFEQEDACASVSHPSRHQHGLKIGSNNLDCIYTQRLCVPWVD